MTAGQIIFIIVWAILAMPMVCLFGWGFDKYSPDTNDNPYEGDMRPILGIAWPATLLPFLIFIVIKIILNKKEL